MHLTGKSDRQARELLGRMLAESDDDAAGLMHLLLEARTMHPLADPQAFLMAGAKRRRQRPSTSYAKRQEEMGEFLQRSLALGRGTDLGVVIDGDAEDWTGAGGDDDGQADGEG